VTGFLELALYLLAAFFVVSACGITVLGAGMAARRGWLMTAVAVFALVIAAVLVLAAGDLK
jgi:hypothetical protein